jgi:multicomponent Na+:H+ antiporter subunit E
MILLSRILLLTAVYLALTANLQPSNTLLGFLLAAAIIFLLRPAGHASSWRLTPESILALIRYVLILIYDLIISGVQTARIVLDPRLPIREGVIAIPTNCDTEAAQALSAHAISVTPGEIVVEMGEEGTMHTHVLDVERAAGAVIRAQMEREQLLSKITQ